MKLSVIIFVLCVTLNTNAQRNYTGSYNNNFGCKIELKLDSTFEFQWHLDLSASWTTGLWTVNGDTVLLKAVLIYETLKKDTDGHFVERLILSMDKRPEVLKQEFSGFLSSGGQNHYPVPTKLYYRRDRLYEISKAGKLVKKKQPEFWTKKHLNPWYVKITPP